MPGLGSTTSPFPAAVITCLHDGSTPAGRGRLARLIASRGGKAAPEAPFVIEHREALTYMLCEAAELEHGIMCQYPGDAAPCAGAQPAVGHRRGPHLARPNLPAPAAHYPAGMQLALIPFGEQALRHFMFLEHPEGMDLQDADRLAAMGAAAPMVNPRDIVP